MIDDEGPVDARIAYMHRRAAEIAGHAPGCIIGHQSGACSCGKGSSGFVQAYDDDRDPDGDSLGGYGR